MQLNNHLSRSFSAYLLLALSCITSTFISASNWHTWFRRTVPIAALYLACHKPGHVEASMDRKTEDRIRAKKAIHLRYWERTKIDIMEEIEKRKEKFSYLEDGFFLVEGFIDISLGFPFMGLGMFAAKTIYNNTEYAEMKRGALKFMKKNQKTIEDLSLESYEDLPCFFPCVRGELSINRDKNNTHILRYDNNTAYLYENNELFNIYTGGGKRIFKRTTRNNEYKAEMFAENPVGPFKMQASQDNDITSKIAVVGKLPHHQFLSWQYSKGMIIGDIWGNIEERLTYETRLVKSIFGNYVIHDNSYVQKPKLQFDEDRFLVVVWDNSLKDRVMRLYNLKKRELTKTFSGTESRDGLYTKLSDHTFASLTDNRIQIFDINKGSSCVTEIWEYGVRAVLQWDDHYLLAGTEHGDVAVWDMRTEKCIYRFTRSGLPVSTLVKMDEETLIVGTYFATYDMDEDGAECKCSQASDYTVWKLIGDKVIDQI